MAVDVPGRRIEDPHASIHRLVRKIAEEEQVPYDLMIGILKQESNYDPNAESSAFARGLMQLMPLTAVAYWDGFYDEENQLHYEAATGKKITEEQRDFVVSQIFDPEKNVRAAARFLRDLRKVYKDYEVEGQANPLVLAAYNAGQGRVDECLKDHDPIDVPACVDANVTYPQVEDYVQKVSRNIADEQQRAFRPSGAQDPERADTRLPGPGPEALSNLKSQLAQTETPSRAPFTPPGILELPQPRREPGVQTGPLVAETRAPQIPPGAEQQLTSLLLRELQQPAPQLAMTPMPGRSPIEVPQLPSRPPQMADRQPLPSTSWTHSGLPLPQRSGSGPTPVAPAPQMQPFKLPHRVRQAAAPPSMLPPSTGRLQPPSLVQAPAFLPRSRAQLQQQPTPQMSMVGMEPTQQPTVPNLAALAKTPKAFLQGRPPSPSIPILERPPWTMPEAPGRIQELIQARRRAEQEREAPRPIEPSYAPASYVPYRPSAPSESPGASSQYPLSSAALARNERLRSIHGPAQPPETPAPQADLSPGVAARPARFLPEPKGLIPVKAPRAPQVQAAPIERATDVDSPWTQEQRWAAHLFDRDLKAAQTDEEKDAVWARVEQARTDPEALRREAARGQHGIFSTGGYQTAGLGLAGASLAPLIPKAAGWAAKKAALPLVGGVLGSIAGPAGTAIGTGIGHAANWGLTGLGLLNLGESGLRASQGLPWQQGALAGTFDVGIPLGSRLWRGLRTGQAQQKAATETAERAAREAQEETARREAQRKATARAEAEARREAAEKEAEGFRPTETATTQGAGQSNLFGGRDPDVLNVIDSGVAPRIVGQGYGASSTHKIGVDPTLAGKASQDARNVREARENVARGAYAGSPEPTQRIFPGIIDDFPAGNVPPSSTGAPGVVYARPPKTPSPVQPPPFKQERLVTYVDYLRQPLMAQRLGSHIHPLSKGELAALPWMRNLARAFDRDSPELARALQDPTNTDLTEKAVKTLIDRGLRFAGTKGDEPAIGWLFARPRRSGLGQQKPGQKRIFDTWEKPSTGPASRSPDPWDDVLTHPKAARRFLSNAAPQERAAALQTVREELQNSLTNARHIFQQGMKAGKSGDEIYKNYTQGDRQAWIKNIQALLKNKEELDVLAAYKISVSRFTVLKKTVQQSLVGQIPDIARQKTALQFPGGHMLRQDPIKGEDYRSITNLLRGVAGSITRWGPHAKTPKHPLDFIDTDKIRKLYQAMNKTALQMMGVMGSVHIARQMNPNGMLTNGSSN